MHVMIDSMYIHVMIDSMYMHYCQVVYSLLNIIDTRYTLPVSDSAYTQTLRV